MAAGAEENHRAELGVHTAAKNQFGAIERDHRLDRDAKEIFRAGFGCDRSLYGTKGGAHRFFAREIQLYSADVAFVGDGFRMDFEDDGETHLPGDGRGFIFAPGDASGNSGNAVESEKFFRFGFGEESPPRG